MVKRDRSVKQLLQTYKEYIDSFRIKTHPDGSVIPSPETYPDPLFLLKEMAEKLKQIEEEQWAPTTNEQPPTTQMKAENI